MAMKRKKSESTVRSFFSDDTHALWKLAKKELKPATEFEGGVINAILRIKSPANAWAFQKGVFCKKCGRNISILDYFLSGLFRHPIPFMRDSVNWEEAFTTSEVVKQILIADHPTTIICVNCGAPLKREEYDLYAHPGGGGLCLRMSSKRAAKFKFLLHNSNPVALA